jgi:hypothetical protein
MKIPIWTRFPKLDECYYRALPELCASIGEVVWIGKWEDNMKKSSTSRLCILVEDLSTLPYSMILPIPLADEVFETVVEYKGIPTQCTQCLALDHMVDKCHKKKGKPQPKPTSNPA